MRHALSAKRLKRPVKRFGRPANKPLKPPDKPALKPRSKRRLISNRQRSLEQARFSKWRTGPRSLSSGWRSSF
jgi:hypothetical protein